MANLRGLKQQSLISTSVQGSAGKFFCWIYLVRLYGCSQLEDFLRDGGPHDVTYVSGSGWGARQVFPVSSNITQNSSDGGWIPKRAKPVCKHFSGLCLPRGRLTFHQYNPEPRAGKIHSTSWREDLKNTAAIFVFSLSHGTLLSGKVYVLTIYIPVSS